MTVREAAEQIASGAVVAFPTETVYGLGADAWNAEAVAGIFALKGRPSDNPLIVHISSPEQASDFAVEIPEPASRLMAACWPGPLAIVLKRRNVVLDMITAGLDTVALRIPDHPIALELIRMAGPLAAPSANRSGRPSPTRPEHVRLDFGAALPLLDGGPCRIGLESTVVDLSRTPGRVLRPGRYTASELSEIAGIEIITGGDGTGPAASPGMKYTHYKPDAEVCWLDRDHPPAPEHAMVITHSTPLPPAPHRIHFSGEFDRLAGQLYDLFRTADRQGLHIVAVEPLPDDRIHPIIAALRNRIGKATGAA